METREMVLFTTDDQYHEKSDELDIGECWWSIGTFPKNKENLIGTKIYFYDRKLNRISMRSTITSFGYNEEGKKCVFFELRDDTPRDEHGMPLVDEDDESADDDFDVDFKLYLDELGIPRRKQSRGWAYRWFPIEIEEVERLKRHHTRGN